MDEEADEEDDELSDDEEDEADEDDAEDNDSEAGVHSGAAVGDGVAVKRTGRREAPAASASDGGAVGAKAVEAERGVERLVSGAAGIAAVRW